LGEEIKKKKKKKETGRKYNGLALLHRATIRKIEITGQKYNGLPYSIGQP